MIKIVFLDIDNTLLDFNACARYAMDRVLSDFGVPRPPNLFSVFQRINDGLWQQLERHEISKDALYSARWNLIFRELGIPLDGETFEQHFQVYLNESSIPVEGACALTEYLSGKYLLCAASNAPMFQQDRRLALAGMRQYFSHIFVSEKIGVPKPQKGFFDACFAQLGACRPEEAIIIGDSLTADISGGAAYGMQTCWFNIARAPVPDPCPATHLVYALSEIQEFL